MFDINENQKLLFFTVFGLQVVLIPWKKKHKTNYYAKKISGKSRVSLI